PDSEKSRIFDALQYNQLADQLVADHVPDSGEWLDRAINFIATEFILERDNAIGNRKLKAFISSKNFRSSQVFDQMREAVKPLQTILSEYNDARRPWLTTECYL